LKDKSDFLRKEIESSLNYFEITRIVQRFDFYSFQNLLERVTLTYRNLDENPHRILAFLPIPREKQRNLKVFDGSGNELTILPSHEIYRVLITLSEDYLDRIFNCMKNLNRIDIEKLEGNINTLKSSFSKIYTYEITKEIEEEIDKAKKIFKDIFQSIGSQDFDDKEECGKLLAQLVILVTIQKKFYVPFFELQKPFLPKRHLTIDLTAEGPKEIDKGILFYIKGDIKQTFSLEPISGASYHLKIMPPEGIDIIDFQFGDLENTALIQKQYEKGRYFHETMFDVSFSPREAEEIRERIDSSRVPAVTLSMRVNPLLRLLYLLVHVAILSPLFIEVLYGNIGVSEFIASLALGATIFVSASIYAIDKKIVLEFALVHLLIACTLLVVELSIFILF